MTNKSIKQQFIDNQVNAFRKNEPGTSFMLNKHHEVLGMIRRNSSIEDRVLDIGCSDGKILKELMTMGYKKLYGIDIQALAKTSFANTIVKYKECDIEKEVIPFAGKFDLIIISDVLEHLFSPHTLMYDLKKKLSPNGKIVFSVPNAGWFLNGMLLTFLPSKLFVSTAFGPWGHTHQFTFYEMRRLANILKYQVIELKGGKLDNYMFKHGLKKILFDIFVWITKPLALRYPSVFSAHIFGVFGNTKVQLSTKDRFDSGV